MFKYKETSYLEKRFIEQRRHLRYPFNYAIKYALTPNSIENYNTGIISNISSSGMCLYTSCALVKGQEIIFKTVLPTFYRKAIVRWCENKDRNFWKSGLEFIQSNN